MKSQIIPPCGGPLALLAAFIAFGGPWTATCHAAADSTDQPKTHTLFMGDDFSVAQDGVYYSVRDVVGRSFVVTIKGRSVKIPMRGNPVSLQIEPKLKITEVEAEVSDLKGERAYTPENDPERKFNRTVVTAESNYAESQMDAGLAQWRMDVFNGVAQSHGQIPSSGPAYANPFESAQSAVKADLTSQLNQEIAVETTPVDNLGDPIGHDLFDAIEVSFQIASDKPLNNPYVVVLTRFHAKSAKPGYAQNHIWAQALDPIGPKPSKVHILAGGLPPGYILENYQVHLYNEGEEVATNVAPKRVELTRDEAFEYLKIEYLGSHKSATLSASPLMGRLPSDLPQRLSQGQYNETYYVRVSKDGLADATYADEACTQRLDDPYLESVVRDLRFKPALKDGTPVEGVSSLTLRRLMNTL